jgi:hypothetical protein
MPVSIRRSKGLRGKMAVDMLHSLLVLNLRSAPAAA